VLVYDDSLTVIMEVEIR